MQDLLPKAETLSGLLIARKQNIAIAEFSSGGLVSAALLSVPGASAYFLGGGVIYTQTARTALLGLTQDDMAGLRPSTEAYARLLATTARARFGATWGIGESGAAGPTGNRYGDAAGHCCIAIAGPTEAAITLETDSADRVANMRAFAAAALDLLARALAA